MIASVVFLTLAVIAVNAQVPIPPKPTGLTYKNGSSEAPIQFEIYIDLICPDSKNAFPTVLKVADYYSSHLRLQVHQFPLPYHRFAYLASMGVFSTINRYGADKTFSYMAAMFNSQPRFSDSSSFNDSTNAILTEMSMVASSFGVDPEGFVFDIINNKFSTETRTDWKLGCRRGVAGTPWFFINGVEVMGSPTWTVDDWKKIIDPLLNKAGITNNSEQNAVESAPLKFLPRKVCPSGTKFCEFLPGKHECCTKGENCIPNVGCRC